MRSPPVHDGFEPLFKVAALAVAALLALSACARDGGAPPPGPADLDTWRADLDAWIEERYASLREPDGWLSLAGLFWLEEGENTFGSDPSNDVDFPADKSPPRIGAFIVAGGADPSVRVRVDPEAAVTHQGARITEMELVTDVDGDPTLLELGSLLFNAIDRGGRIGIRLKDRSSPLITAFEGIERFEPDPAWRVEARFEAYDPPKKILVPNIIGPELPEDCLGRLTFELGGAEHSLDSLGQPGKRLFIVFGDQTNGSETYGGGRFLYADWPGPDGVTRARLQPRLQPAVRLHAVGDLSAAARRRTSWRWRSTAGEKTYGPRAQTLRVMVHLTSSRIIARDVAHDCGAFAAYAATSLLRLRLQEKTRDGQDRNPRRECASQRVAVPLDPATWRADVEASSA